ncbi:hypothetical protein LDENG_00010860 [Lucifuga dentata]|nr:hypothetical protein LDENG_00010860 [Lucifuga dentata]
MAPKEQEQLEKLVDEVLKGRDLQALDLFLQKDTYGGSALNCSKQFLNKLAKLVSRGLDQKDAKSAILGLTVLYKCGNNLMLPEGQGLTGLIAQETGFVHMVHWFEKCRQLWIQCGPQKDETLLNLSEDFLESIMVVHEACREGTYKITESFLYPIGQLAADPRINITIQKEAIRKFNIILDKIPVELKKEKKILSSQEASDIMSKLANQILEGGDYDLQVTLMEALCRMATSTQRKELANHWFSVEHVANAFVKIYDSEFETDCRKFLNLVNGMQENRRVYSHPCLEAYLDKHELLMPSDEKLEEFWIDFNLGSHSISFYFSLADEQESQWETICINEDEIQSYTVTEEGKRQVLRLKLTEVVVVGEVEGSNLTIHFSSTLDILQAVRSVYGDSKNEAAVPESKVSLSEGEKNTAPYCLPAPSASIQMVTPARSRISESSTFIRSSSGGSVHGARSFSAIMPSNSLGRAKEKPSLEMVYSCHTEGEVYRGELRTTAKTSHGTMPSSTMTHSITQQCDKPLQSKALKQPTRKKAEKHKKNILLAEAVEIVLAGQGEEQEPLEQSFVPDSQPTTKTGKNIGSHWKKLSVSEMLTMPTQKVNSGPHSGLEQQQGSPSSTQRASLPGLHPISHKQFHSDLTQRLQKVLDEMTQAPAPQEPAASPEKLSEASQDPQNRSLMGLCGPTSCVSKEQQAKKKGCAKEKRNQIHPLGADPAPLKASAKVAPTEVLKERTTPNASAKPTRAPSSKEKRNAEVASSMVKLISSHYKIIPQFTAKATVHSISPCLIPPSGNSRPVFDMNWVSTTKKDIYGAIRLRKPLNKSTQKSARQNEDIFAFNVDATLSIGGNSKLFTDTSAISSSDAQNSFTLLKGTKKEQPAAKEKRNVKKHLFSDTDTDYTMTEVSWIRESSRKPKPKVTKYSRHLCFKPKTVSPETTYKPDPSSKPIKENTKLTKKKPCAKQAVEQPKTAANPAGRRPQRAAAATAKSYRDLDTDESQSESETRPDPKPQKLEDAQAKKKNIVSKQSSKSFKKLKSVEHSSQSKSELPPTPKKCFVGQQGRNEKASLESAEVKKKKNAFESTMSHQELERNNLSALEQPPPLSKHQVFQQQKTEKILQANAKLNRKNDIPAKEQTSTLKDSWAACQASHSPPSIEKMRCKPAEMLPPTLDLTQSPILTPQGSPLPASPCQDTSSPIPCKPHSAVSSKGNFKPSSFYSRKMKCSTSKPQSLHSISSLPSLTLTGQSPERGAATRPSAAEISPVKALSFAPQSPLSPLLTSTAVELEKPSMLFSSQSPSLEDTLNCRLCYDFSKVSPVSHASLSYSSTKSSMPSSIVKAHLSAALAVAHKKEKTPTADRSLKSAQHLISGPSRKRHISHSLSSNSEDDEKVEKKTSKSRGQRCSRMKPRKLFKSFTEVYAEGETRQAKSSTHKVSSSNWEVETQDMDEESEMPEISANASDMCQHFSTELKKKFQSRYRMMEAYNKQSLKAIQQHVSSLNVEVSKYRTQSLEQVQRVLLEEIHNLEQDNTILKSMEKDLTMYWKKQTTAFHSYREQETRRYETMRQTFQNNACHSLEYEERIFTSQMCLMRQDMKSVQDRLLSEMQEGEIHSVKRSLHALFFPEGARF